MIKVCDCDLDACEWTAIGALWVASIPARRTSGGSRRRCGQPRSKSVCSSQNWEHVRRSNFRFWVAFLPFADIVFSKISQKMLDVLAFA